MRPSLLVQGILGVQFAHLVPGVLSSSHRHGHSHVHAQRHHQGPGHFHDDTWKAQAKPRHFVRDVQARQEPEPDYKCSATKGCPIGCCGAVDPVTGLGVCGGGEQYCGESCISQCDWKAECDPGTPGWGLQYANSSTCPLNVCCSEFGFCGITPGFCGGVLSPSPECGPESKTADKITIGYYEGWNGARPCGTMAPHEIPLGYYTHIFYSFALIHPTTFHIVDMDAETGSHYSEVTALKTKQRGLEVWIAIGGWAMNDPGDYRTTFSDLAKSDAAQDAFFESLITFMGIHGFDGVDIDWEYPVAEDRGGIPEDYDNFPRMMARMRARLNASGKKYGTSLTLPASYWYMQGFNLAALEPSVDFFNIMTYDIHGTWDSTVKAIGPKAFAHTNMTEIQIALELLWKNNVNPGRVNLGLGFYGRSFTMKDPNCMTPGCEFTGGAGNGTCTGTSGVLSAAEINAIIQNEPDVQVTFDAEAAVKIVTWGGNQWVSYDDEETLALKLQYANRRCLGGTMVWAIDLDDGTLINALGANLSRNKTIIYEPNPGRGTDGGKNTWVVKDVWIYSKG
ncbi:chitinase [Naviculisporaceae sp. PSN 640]